MRFAGVDHHQTNGVVDDTEHAELPEDPVGRLAPQDIHLHRRLEMTQVRLDLPSETVELGHGPSLMLPSCVGLSSAGELLIGQPESS